MLSEFSFKKSSKFKLNGLVFVREVDFDSMRSLFTRDNDRMTFDPSWLCVCVSASVVTVASAMTSLLSDVLPGVKKQ